MKTDNPIQAESRGGETRDKTSTADILNQNCAHVPRSMKYSVLS